MSDDEYPLKDAKGLEKIERLALRRRFDIDPDKLARVVDRQCDIANDIETPNREATAAARAVLAAEGMNQKDEHKVIDVGLQLENSELLEIANELGIDPSVIVDGTVEAGGSSAGDGDEGRGRVTE